MARVISARRLLVSTKQIDSKFQVQSKTKKAQFCSRFNFEPGTLNFEPRRARGLYFVAGGPVARAFFLQQGFYRLAAFDA